MVQSLLTKVLSHKFPTCFGNFVVICKIIIKVTHHINEVTVFIKNV